MAFALTGIVILAPFALCLAMLLSLESHRSNKVRQIRSIAEDWHRYLDEFDTHSEQMRQANGSTVPRFNVADAVSYKRFDADVVSTQR